MASFKALNVESDDEDVEEIDNTKEIQIEDALKLYQTALKYHSQESTLEQAGQAYKDLFQSEIFKFPESQSEFERVTAFEQQQGDDYTYYPEVPDEPVANQATTDNAPSTLPQVLHLSYKNRGEYFLDLLRSVLRREKTSVPKGDAASPTPETQKRLTTDLVRALEDFTQALDKDEDDLDLWRRAAQICQSLGAVRLARFCLESAVDGDEEGMDDILSLPNFAGNFDEKKLREVWDQVQDDLATLLDSYDNNAPGQLSDYLETQLKGYSFLPDSPLLTLPNTKPLREVASHVYEIVYLEVEEYSLDSIGVAIRNRLKSERDGLISKVPGTAIRFSLPPRPTTETNNLVSSAANEGSEPVKRNGVLSNSGDDRRKSSVSIPESPSAPSEISGIQSVERRRSEAKPTTVDLPTRKRSADVADLPETAGGERTKSKRILQRRSTAVERTTNDMSGAERSFAQDQRIEANMQADSWAFKLIADLTRKIGVKTIGTVQDIRKLTTPHNALSLDDQEMPLTQATKDLYASMQHWTTAKTQRLQGSDSAGELAVDTSDPGLMSFLENPNQNGSTEAPQVLTEYVQNLDEFTKKRRLTIEEVAILWTQLVIADDDTLQLSLDFPHQPNLYLNTKWTEQLKNSVVDVLTLADEHIYRQVSEVWEFWQNSDTSESNEEAGTSKSSLLGVFEMAQALFELHLDAFASSNNPDRAQGKEEINLEKERLQRWCNLAREIGGFAVDQLGTEVMSKHELTSRHLWASVFQVKETGDISRDHLITCLEDLKNQFSGQGIDTIKLYNSAVMPELSAKAAEKEISKLETMDFFLAIFHAKDQHPADLIEMLEPILITQSVQRTVSRKISSSQRERGSSENASDGTDDFDGQAGTSHLISKNQRVLSEFVKKSSMSLKMTLWRRLRDAYENVDIPAKVLYIEFYTFDLVLDELDSNQYMKSDPEGRDKMLLGWLKELNILTVSMSTRVKANPELLSYFEDSTLRRFMSNLLKQWNLLYVVALYDDHSQAVQKVPLLTNPFRAYPFDSFHAASIKFHDMQIRTIVLVYKVLVEVMDRFPEKFDKVELIKHNYLSYVHYSLGKRRICKASDNLYLKFMRDELLALAKRDKNTADEFAQILYDLYELHLFSTPNEKQDHGCEPDYLDRTTALDLIDPVIERVQAANLKDFPKLELAKTVEKVQTALGPMKQTKITRRNRKAYDQFIKSAIDPLFLFHSLRGIGHLSTAVSEINDNSVASKGWYFLMAQANLAKYRRAKGQPSQGLVEDLESAVNFLIHDLENDMERWETWGRLAYSQDMLIEEAVLWSAEKLNGSRAELIQLQRASIHAYSMAVATAIRNSKPNDQNKGIFAELYADFGTRVYSSARPPYSMSVFANNDVSERFYCANDGSGIYKQASRGLRPMKALQLASVLFHKSIRLRPDVWMNHLMLGKCLWKCHLKSANPDQPGQFENAQHAMTAFQKALDIMPARKDPAKQELILEPIYKIIAVVHKLVERGEVQEDRAVAQIETTLCKQKQFEVTRLPTFDKSSGSDAWGSYMIEVLKILRAADKPKWHHRIVFKVAQILYKKLNRTKDAAIATKNYLLEQHIYSSKTSALTIWKPERERAGRHWVYMTRYTRFLSHLLEQTDDLEMMQSLTRRVRKKPAEFFDHEDLWNDVSADLIKLYRRHADIPLGHHNNVLLWCTTEDFASRNPACDTYLSDPKISHPLKDVLRESLDLKKMSGTLSKPSTLDELIVDAYAALFTRLPHLPGAPKVPATTREVTTTTTSTTSTTQPESSVHPDVAPVAPGRPNVMALNNVITLDGAADQNKYPSTLSVQQSQQPPSRPSSTSIEVDGHTFPTRTKASARLISRREILKRASETSAYLLTPAAKAERKQGDAPLTGNGRRVSGAGGEIEGGVQSDAAAGSGDGTTAKGGAKKEDGDDSELSELDEEVELLPTPSRSMFPNLKRRESLAEVKREDEGSGNGDGGGVSARDYGENEGGDEGDGDGTEDEEEEEEEEGGDGDVDMADAEADAGDEAGDEEGEGDGDETEIDESMEQK